MWLQQYGLSDSKMVRGTNFIEQVERYYVFENFSDVYIA